MQKYNKYLKDIEDLEADLTYQIKVNAGEAVSSSTSSTSSPSTFSFALPSNQTYENVGVENKGFASTETASDDGKISTKL